jgi:hypothetical protein
VNPNHALWQEILIPYRARDWYECVRMARPVVDEDPHDLAARFLLAELYVKLDNRGLALLQYERMLPLAVGRGDLIGAMATQRRLDELHPTSAQHAKRYMAMHQWFLSLAQRGSMPVDPAAATTSAMLLGLAPAAFSRAAEASRLRLFDLEPCELEAGNQLRWIVVFGQVRWAVGSGSTARETVALAGATVDLGELASEPQRLTPELPTLCLSIDTVLAGLAEPPSGPESGTSASSPPDAAPGSAGSADPRPHGNLLDGGRAAA